MTEKIMETKYRTLEKTSTTWSEYGLKKEYRQNWEKL